jgi:hypothetical protein
LPLPLYHREHAIAAAEARRREIRWQMYTQRVHVLR